MSLRGDLMSEFLDGLRAELAARGARIIDAGTDGIGALFRDGHDAWWVLPDDPLSSVPVPSAGHADTRPILAEYERLDALRSRSIHAIRHHLAARGVRAVRIPSGSWPIQAGVVSSQLSVGAALTARFAGSDDVVAAVRSVFANSIVRPPSPRRVQRYLATQGDPAEELPWLDRPPAIASGQTPMAILVMMGVCKMIRVCGNTAEGSRLPRPEELAEVVQPRGRIGRALAHLAAALPDARASVELLSGVMTIEFDDGLDGYRIRPRSRELVASIRRDGPDQAGDDLIAEFRKLDADRARVIAALRVALPRLGFRVQEERGRLHYGRRVRESSLDLGKGLTEALQQGTATEAVRTLLSPSPGLAEEVAKALTPERPDRLPEPSTAVLLPPEPPPVSIPQIEDLDLARLDQLARSILDRFKGQREVLRAFFDPLLHDPASDTWVTRDDWLRAANQFRGEGFPDPDAELIRLELGATVDLHAWLTTLGQVGYHGENSEAEIMSVYRYRREAPDIARAWFAPEPLENCPEAETRSAIGDWIAARYVAASIEPDDPDPWRLLSRLTPAALEVFFEAGQIERWRDRAVRAIDESWDWIHFDSDLLKAAVVHGWTEVGAALHRNAYLVDAIFSNDRMLIYCAGRLFLAWSRLAPSVRIARLVGTLLERDLSDKAATLARAAGGTMVERRPDVVSQFADAWLTELQCGLAVAWMRSRTLIDEPVDPRR